METQTERFAGFPYINGDGKLLLNLGRHTCLPKCLRFRPVYTHTHTHTDRVVERSANGPSKWPSTASCVYIGFGFSSNQFLFHEPARTARITINIYEALSSPWLPVFIQPTDQSASSPLYPACIRLISSSPWSGSLSSPFFLDRGPRRPRRWKREDNEEESSREAEMCNKRMVGQLSGPRSGLSLSLSLSLSLTTI